MSYQKDNELQKIILVNEKWANQAKSVQCPVREIYDFKL